MALEAMNTAGGVPPSAVDAAERELGVIFPASYRKFLREYGAAVGNGFEIAGLFAPVDGGEPPMWRSVVLSTKQIRRMTEAHISSSLIPIADDGQGIIFYLETDRCYGPRIVAYGPGIDGEVVANTFEEFVARAAMEAM